MGKLKSYLEKQKQKRKESKSFRSIIEKRNTAAARQAYAEEAEKVARERAKARARREPIFRRLGTAAVKKATAPPKTRARRYIKTVTRRASPKRRTSRRTTYRRPKTRTRVVYREAPRQEERPFGMGDLF